MNCTEEHSKVSFLAGPISRHFSSFIFANVMLMLPTLFSMKSGAVINYGAYLGYCLNFMFVYVLFAIGDISLRRYDTLRTLYISIVCTFTFILAVTNIFLWSSFKIWFHGFAMMLLNETNPNESIEFLHTYFFSPLILKVLIFMIFGVIMWYVLYRMIRRSKEMIKSSIIICIGIVALYSLRWFGPDYEFMYFECPFQQSSLFQLYNGYLQYSSINLQIQKCAESCHNISVDSCEFTSPNIVLVIGESYNRHHASIYGYELQTTPYLDSTPGLYVFDDIISSVNFTAESFRNLMSCTPNHSQCRWCDVPTFPAVFKTAGYNVLLWSNQFPYGKALNGWNSEAAFFNYHDISRCNFSCRNNTTFNFDAELLDDYIQKRDSLEKNKNLIIFHFQGQHVSASSRFPSELAKYSTSDYHRPNLTTEQIQEIADYDNATLYNDMNLAKIIDLFKDTDAIIIMTADHGDEANDFRPHIGRSYDFPEMAPDVLHCQFDVPFIIYATNTYKERHPEIITTIEQSLHKASTLDDLPFMLFYLAGIKSKYNCESYNLLSPDYTVRERFLYNIQTHESISYDQYTYCLK